MAYCSNCKSVVHRTTKICPSCGGDFSKLFGPLALWGKPPKEAAEAKSTDQIASLKSAERKIRQEYLDRKAAEQAGATKEKPFLARLPPEAAARVREKTYERKIAEQTKREKAESERLRSAKLKRDIESGKGPSAKKMWACVFAVMFVLIFLMN